MVDITAKMVKELRDATGAGPLDCKKALQETDGDMQAAVDYLREKDLARANKKLGKGRTMNEGLVTMYQNDDKTLGVIAQVSCETDFVSSNEIFQEFAQDIANQIAQTAPADVEELMAQPFHKDESKTVEQVLKETVAEIGESVEISDFARFEAAEGNLVEIYQHFNKLIAAMVEVTGQNAEVAYDIAMHISNLKPRFLSRDLVPADVTEAEEAIQMKRAVEEGKPEHIAEKMVTGRMGKFYQEIVLLEQAFLKDDSQTIEELLKDNDIEVARFARFATGEDSHDEDADE